MATAADIVTGILVTELTADDDLVVQKMNNEKRMMLKRFFFNKQKRKRNMAYVTMNTLIRLSLKKKKLALIKRRKFKAKKKESESKVDHDYVDVVVSRFSSEFQQFKEHFGIKRKTFDKIVLIVSPKFGNQEKSSLSVERKVLIGLWILSTQDSFRSISEKFDIPKSSAYYAFIQLISALHAVVQSYIVWPDDQSKETIAAEFHRLYGFPGVFGIINSCQIPVKISSVDDSTEVKIEPYSTVALQAVCDHRMKFMDIHIGSPQPAHAITCTWKFFEGSGLGQKLCGGDVTVPPDLYLLGDGTYPLKTYLLSPYKDEGLSEEKEFFNAVHKPTSSVINKAFSFLLSKFSRLKFVDTSRYDLVPQIVTAACVLHNIILEDSDVDAYLSGTEDQKCDAEHVHPCPQADHDIDVDAKAKRDAVAEKMRPVHILKVEPES